jgi:hypothetical protein
VTQKPEAFSITNRFTFAPSDVVEGTMKLFGPGMMGLRETGYVPAQTPKLEKAPSSTQIIVSSGSSPGVFTSRLGTGFAVVFVTCTSAAARARAAFGAMAAARIAARVTALEIIKILFANLFISSPLFGARLR